MRKKVSCKNKIEFINEVAEDCLKDMSAEDKEYLTENPVAIEYHFSYCLYIRNNYIHNRDFSEVSFFTHADDLSSDIIRMIFSKLLPDYEYGNFFIEILYDNKDFILLRKKYKNKYGEYPEALVERYKTQACLEPVHSREERSFFNNEELEREIEIIKRNYDNALVTVDSLIKELKGILRN